MEYLEFMFSGFWVFVGHWILMGMAIKGIVHITRAIMRVPVTNVTNNYSVKKP